MLKGTPVSQPITERKPQILEDALLQNLLEELYKKQLAPNVEIAIGDKNYLHIHGSALFIEDHIRTFQRFRPYLPDAGTIMDWGCYHAPDSCLLRACFGERLSLHSCDFGELSRFQAFQDFAQTEHKLLEDIILLPYASNFFDAVIGSGVLEHTAMDDESLKELYRVIKPNGVLMISHLPNWLSIQEWLRRVFMKKKGYHHRLYSMGEAKQLLKRRGFLPLVAGYNTFFWERKLAAVGLSRWEQGLAKLLRRLLPVHVFSSTLFLVAKKVKKM
jgi:SAM-dependent methyltransferase